MHEPDLVVAAGAVTMRRRRGTTEVLLVHRPRYDDWSFPKGKLDPGEGVHEAAVREVQEETGLTVRLGPPLSPQVYSVGNGTARPKVVHYWVARCTGDDDVSDYRPNDEIDDVRWFPMHDVVRVLDYERDRSLVLEARPFRRRFVPLIVLRHAQARPRKQWGGDDRGRPLSDEGLRQAERLSSLLAAYGVQHVVSSSSERCVQSVAPYASATGYDLELTDVLSEQDALPHLVMEEMEALVELREPTVVCGHRPVLPMMFQSLGLDPTSLEPGDAVVLHHRHGRIVAVDRVPAPSGD
jgi:8-oxo-(d)GTP phosphatase